MVINASVLLKVVLNDPYRVELVDNLVMTPAIKTKVLVPYLASLYDSLVLRGEKPHLGVPRYALNEVSLLFYSLCEPFICDGVMENNCKLIVPLVARTDWGADVQFI